jgi:hypothetical protein
MIAKAEATSTKEPAPIRRTAAKTEIAAKKAPTRKDPALKKEPVLRTQPLAKAEGKPRPPTLDEWLANSEPTSR